jgi:hypothetical protein
MISRCTSPKTSGFQDYGGRGIRVCDEWFTFTNFFRDMGFRPFNSSLDRINNDGNYEPGNCRWASRLEQANNTRFNHRITFKGETKTVAQWSRHFGYSRNLIMTRIRRGWPLEKAFTEPPKLKCTLAAEERLKSEQVKQFVVRVQIPITVEAKTYEEAAWRATRRATIAKNCKSATVTSITQI